MQISNRCMLCRERGSAGLSRQLPSLTEAGLITKSIIVARSRLHQNLRFVLASSKGETIYTLSDLRDSWPRGWIIVYAHSDQLLYLGVLEMVDAFAIRRTLQHK